MGGIFSNNADVLKQQTEDVERYRREWMEGNNPGEHISFQIDVRHIFFYQLTK